MENPSDSSKNALNKRIEEIEEKLRSFEQGMKDLQGELEGLKEMARTAEEETPPLAPAAEQPHVTAGTQEEFELTLPDSYVDPGAAKESTLEQGAEERPAPEEAPTSRSETGQESEELDLHDAAAREKEAASEISAPPPPADEEKLKAAAVVAGGQPEKPVSEKPLEKITPPPLPKEFIRDETAAEKEPELISDRDSAVHPEESSPSGAGADEEAGMDLETRIGAIWFNRLGLVAIIIGFALLGRYITPHLQPWHKVIGSYFVSALLFCCGWYFEQRLKQFARPVMAGALSIVFFISFAAHFVKPMACIPLWGSLVLMSMSIGLIFLCAERWRSEPTAGLAIFLGHVAAFVAGKDADTFSLVAILFLSLSAFGLLLRHNWVPLSLFSVVAAFLSHLVWALQDHSSFTPGFQFWVNFQFLTSYYLIFLAADLIFRHRIFKGGVEAFTLKQRTAGRCVGPAALVLYVTLTASLFHATIIHWNQIHCYLFPLAALQVFLVRYHHKRANPDYSFYGVTATVFALLGLFSWIEGLTLNMSLAALALLLLVLARRMRLAFLTPLAEVVLMVNFIHFWVSDASQIDSWPAYLGSVMTATVYFVKSRLEETWLLAPKDEAFIDARWSSVLQEIFARLATPLAYLHAAAGSVLIFYVCRTFFQVPWDAAAVVGFSLAAMVSASILASGSMMIAAWALQLGFLLLLPLHGGRALYPYSSDLSWSVPWVTDQGLCFVIVAAAMAALALSRRRYKPVTAVLGLGTLTLAIPAVFIAAGVRNPSPWLFLLWAFAPAAFWLQTEFSKKPFFAAEKTAGDDLWERTFLWINEKRSFARGVLALTAALLTYRVISEIMPSPWVALLLFTLMVPVLLVCVIRRDSVYLLMGMVAHCSLVTFFFVTCFHPKAMWGDRLLSWWFVTVLVWAAAVLIATAIKRKRTSFVWGGLAVLGATMIGIMHCLDTHTINFQPFILWLVTVACFWRVTEVLLRGRAIDSADFQDWRDRWGLDFLSKSSTYMSIAISVAAAGLLTMISYRYLDMKFVDNVFALLSGSVTFYAVLFFVLAALLRSPSLCAAYVVFLSTAHGIFQFHLGRTGMGAVEYPVVAVFLLAVSLLFGGAAEWLLQRRGESLTAPQRTWAGIGSWYPYVLSFLLSAVFFQHHHNLSISLENWDFLSTPFRFPPQLVLALLAVLAGRSFRLPRLQLAAYGYSLLVVANMAGWVLMSSGYRIGLLSAGIIVFVLIIALERIIAGQRTELLKPLGENLSKVMKDILVIGSGVFMLLVIPFSDVVRGYWTTVSLSFVALTLMGLGFWWRERMYRRTALALFAISIFRIGFIDIANLSPFYRMMAFFTLGGCLVLVSFLYSRFRKEINRWL